LFINRFAKALGSTEKLRSGRSGGVQTKEPPWKWSVIMRRAKQLGLAITL
jgi:hypothetical protein